MKIFMCVNNFWPLVGGAEKVVQIISEKLSEHHDISIITRKLKNRASSPFSFRILEYLPGNHRTFFNHIDKHKPDIVFIYSDVFDFFRHIITNTYKKHRTIIALCGANWLYSHRNFTNILYRNISNIDKIICHSQCDRDYKLCTSNNILSKTDIIPNGVDIDEFDNNDFRRDQLIKDVDDKIWILNVSNFFPGKGQEFMIPILNKLPDPNKIAYIQVCSDIDFDIGKQLESHWRISCKTKLNSLIVHKIIKNPNREQVIGLFKNSNVFCFTSQKEVAPLVILESMAARLPWISTDVGNTTELKGGKSIGAVKDSKFFSHFDERVINLFAKIIPELWHNNSISEEGRLQIENDMNWKKILPKYTQLVENL